MPRVLLMFLLCILLFSCGKDDGPSMPPDYKNGIGGTGFEMLWDAVATPGGGVMAVGYTSSPDPGSGSSGSTQNNLWVVSADKTGKPYWEKKFPADGPSEATRIINGQPGGYLVLGTIKTGSTSGLLLRLEIGGSEVSRATIPSLGGGGSWWDVAVTKDGGYIIVGAGTASNGAAIKFNGGLEPVWTKNFPGKSGMAVLTGVATTDDGGYIVTGVATAGYAPAGSNHHGGEDGWIAKLNSSGNIVWEKFVGDGSDNQFSSMIPAHDNGFIVVGRSNKQLWLYRFDNNGEKVWEKLLGNQSTVPVIRAASDKTYLVGIESSDKAVDPANYKGGNEGLAMRFDVNGNVLKQRLVGTAGGDNTYSIVESAPGEYFMIGMTSARTNFVDHSDGWIQPFKF